MINIKLKKRLREIAKRQFEISYILNTEYWYDDEELVELASKNPISYQRLLMLTNELIELSLEEANIQGKLEQYKLQGVVLDNLLKMVDSQKTILEAGRVR